MNERIKAQLINEYDEQERLEAIFFVPPSSLNLQIFFYF